jgi:hypothetical protein
MIAAMDLLRVSRLSRAAALAAAAWLVLPGVAVAQVRDVEAYKAVVLQNATALRCDNSDKFYKVAELASGTFVTVDGESADWARVAYPPNLSAFVAAEQVEYNAAAKTAKLKEPSKLKAPHLASGLDGSWKSLLARELPAGSELKVLEEIKNKDGKVQGYRVPAPDAARGYLTKASIRKATPEELAKLAGTATPAAQPPVAQPPAIQPAEAKPADTKPTDTKPADATPPAVTPAPVDLTSPAQPTGAAPTTIEQKSDPNAPVEVVAAPVAAPEAKPAPAREPSAIDLESTFQRIRREDPMTAELDELTAAYQRLIAERPAGDRRRKQMEQRVELLDMMRDYRDKRRAVEQANAEARLSRDEFQKKMNEYDLQRQYAIVGLLMPSTVYDGGQLPLMFRLQSVGGSVPRTLGYIKPTPELNLPSKVGVVVGVVGENKFDSSLRLNVIEAVRVDPLQAARNPIKVGN